MKQSGRVPSRHALMRLGGLISATALLTACGAAEPSDAAGEENLGAASQALVTEDGLADAYALFKQTFTGFGFDQQFNMGYGFHPGLSTEKLPGAAQGGQ